MVRYRVLHLIIEDDKEDLKEIYFDYNRALESFCDVTCLAPESYIVDKHLNLDRSFKSALLQIRYLVKKLDIEFLICHNQKSQKLARLALFFTGVKIINVLQKKLNKTFLLRNFFYYKTSLILPNKTFAENIPCKDYKVIYRAMKPLQEEPKRENEITKIGFYGRLLQNTGVQLVIKALGLLNKAKFPCNLLIAGDGPYLKALKNLAFFYGLEDKIEFIKEIDKKSFYQKVDIVCLASFNTNYCTGALEAMAHARPLVAPRLPVMKEVIEDGMNGLLFEVGNHHELADKIRILGSNKDIYQSITLKGLKEIEKKYNLEELKKNLEVFISSLLPRS